MKLEYILLALALLMPLAISSPATEADSLFTGDAIDIAHSISDHALGGTVKASESEFVGSVKSDKYHYPSCRWAEKIKPENEIWFSSSQDARNHGYVPCGVCSPP